MVLDLTETMQNKNTTESGQLVSGVSIVLRPPRSLISLKRQTFTCGVIIQLINSLIGLRFWFINL
jgi:hypothetical protein